MSWDRMCKKKSDEGLGFRKLYDFNLAFLGKQGWRLITKQDSMVSKVYKARYYPDSNFLIAKIGSNPNYVWRSILESQELLKSGVARRVGNSFTVDIIHDSWLPCENDPYIHIAHETLKGNKVSSLITMGQDNWDTNLTKDIFSDRDVNVILSIPIKEWTMICGPGEKIRWGNIRCKVLMLFYGTIQRSTIQMTLVSGIIFET